MVLLLFMGEEARAQEQVEEQYSSFTTEVTTTEFWMEEWQATDEPAPIEAQEVQPDPVADQYEPEASIEPEPAPEPEPVFEPEPDPVFEPEPTPELEPAPEPMPEPKPGPAPEPMPEPAPETPIENQFGPDAGATPEPAPVPNTPVEDQYGPGSGAEPLPVPEPTPAPNPTPEPVPAPAPELAPEPEPVPVPAPELPGQYEPDPGTQAPVPETPVTAQYDPGAGGAVPPPAAPTDGQPPVEGPPVEDPAVQEDLGVEPAPAPTEPMAPPPLDARASESPGVPAPEENVFVPAWASSLGAAISDATASLTGAVFGTFEAFTNPPDPGPTLGGFWDLVGASLTESFFGGQTDQGVLDDVREGAATSTPGSQSSPENVPQPFPAGTTPPGVSQAASSGSGISAGGGVPLLLLCVLISVALLARWEGKLSWLRFLSPVAYCAPRRALERPG